LVESEDAMPIVQPDAVRIGAGRPIAFGDEGIQITILVEVAQGDIG